MNLSPGSCQPLLRCNAFHMFNLNVSPFWYGRDYWNFSPRSPFLCTGHVNSMVDGWKPLLNDIKVQNKRLQSKTYSKVVLCHLISKAAFFKGFDFHILHNDRHIHNMATGFFRNRLTCCNFFYVFAFLNKTIVWSGLICGRNQRRVDIISTETQWHNKG